MPTTYSVAQELEQELGPRPVIRVRYVRERYGEFEAEPGLEAFDPSPPPPGTTLLTNFPFGRATPITSANSIPRQPHSVQ